MSWRRSETMTSRAVRFTLLIAAIGFFGAAVASAWAEGGDEAALAAAMKNATATLQGGLRASEAQGTPISAKFEIEDGKLQLSVYTMKGSDFMEVVADPNTRHDRKGGEDNGCRGFEGSGRAKGRHGESEGAVADRHRDGGQCECRVPGGQRRPRAEERTGDSRGDLASGNIVQEGDGEARLNGGGVGPLLDS